VRTYEEGVITDTPSAQAVSKMADCVCHTDEPHCAKHPYMRREKPPAPCPARSPHQDVLLALPEDAQARKGIPLCTGVLDYFPAALAAVAAVSKAGNDQHNPGEPLHWARRKSADQADTIVRHLMQRGTLDSDGHRHSAKVAWRALALLQEEIEKEAGFIP
jgi:hypothetical protein